jgi:hypothetical protein
MKLRLRYRQVLTSNGNQTVLTNVFTGPLARAIATRMVREIGPISELVPDFPLAGGFSAPLRGFVPFGEEVCHSHRRQRQLDYTKSHYGNRELSAAIEAQVCK